MITNVLKTATDLQHIKHPFTDKAQNHSQDSRVGGVALCCFFSIFSLGIWTCFDVYTAYKKNKVVPVVQSQQVAPGISVTNTIAATILNPSVPPNKDVSLPDKQKARPASLKEETSSIKPVLIGKSSITDLENSTPVEILIKVIQNPFNIEFVAFLDSSEQSVGRVVFEKFQYSNGVYGSKNIPDISAEMPLAKYGVGEKENVFKEKLMISFITANKNKYKGLENVLVQAVIEYSLKLGYEGRVIYFNTPANYFLLGFHRMNVDPEHAVEIHQSILDEIKASELEGRKANLKLHEGGITFLPSQEIEVWKEKIKTQTILFNDRISVSC